MKQLTILLLMLLSIGCKNNADLTMERGIQYFEWNLVDKAILEFNQVVHMFPTDSRRLDYDQVQLLSQAHHNLAVAYAKKECLQMQNVKHDLPLSWYHHLKIDES